MNAFVSSPASLSVFYFSLFFLGSLCSQAPAGSANSLQYQLGTEYRYTYASTVLLNDPPPGNQTQWSKNAGKEVGYQVTGEVSVDCVWQNPSFSWEYVFQLKIENPQLAIKSRTSPDPQGFKHHSSPLDSFDSNVPIFFHWKSGIIKYIYSANTETASSLNLKRAVASLFMLQPLAGEAKELDASGRCRVFYEYTGEHGMRKRKWECGYTRPASTFASRNEIFGVTESSEFLADYQLSPESRVVNVTTNEVKTLRATARQQAGVMVVSSQDLRLTAELQSKNQITASSAYEAIQDAAKKLGVQYIEESLELEEEQTSCSGVACKQLNKAVQDLRTFLKDSNVATRKATEAFMVLLKILRLATKETIVPVLKDSKNKSVLPQLLDVVAAAQTRDAHESAMEILNVEHKSNIDLPERYLLAVSLSTHPSEYLLQDLFALVQKKIPNEKLLESAILTLVSVTRTFSSLPGNSLKQVVTDVKDLVVSRLAACKDENCRNMYLRALRNLSMPETASTILEYVHSKDRKTAVAAMKALKSLPGGVPESDLREAMLKVYLQLGKRYDSSARTLALDILLEKSPTEEVLQLIMESVKRRDNKELGTFTLQRIAEYAAKSQQVRQSLQQVLKDPTINNYDVLAQGGLSTVLSRAFFSDGSMDATYSSSTEMASGMLKRSAFDVYLTNEKGQFELLSFGLFAGGLSSFTSSGSSGDEADDEDATAGMEITLAGVQLRPIVFFSGQGELMGHVWSGTASERTSALQATVLLQDTRKIIPLHNGFTAVFNLQGAVSFDFAGQVQISLWNRNAHSLVENVAAVETEGSLQIATSFVRSQVDFRVNAEMKVEFSTDTDFYNDLTMCLQMNQPEFSLTHSVEKQESIPGTKHRIHKGKKKVQPVSGRSFALNHKNAEQCRVMFNDS